jgi:peptidoglycan/LPS O-acetylase OafA/YrhL
MTMVKLNKDETNTPKPSRLHYLDGLRGIAILLVLFFHAYSNDWVDALPYHDQYDHITLFHFGRYGVQLFFIISGFVIAMTLEKCKSFWDFMLRRWLRLFPAMIVGSLLILITAPLFTARPYGVPLLQDALPGLLFIEPEVFRLFFPQNILEGSFWTLFVEMKFYILAGILYFSFGSKKMIAVLVVMFLSTIAFEFAAPHLPATIVEQLKTILHYLNWAHYGWFAAGALFYQYYVTKNNRFWFAAVLLALIAARCLGGFPTISMIYASTIVLIFALSMTNTAVQKILSNKILVFFGFISYPLYLVHEQAMVSMINQLHNFNAEIPSYALPILPVALDIVVAWLIAKYFEPMTRKAIKQLLSFKTVNLSQKLD